MTKLWIVFAVCIVTFLAGLGLGWKLYHPNDKPTGVDQPTVYLRDTSVVFKVVHDTVLKDKLIQLPGTTIIGEAQINVKPGVDINVRDTSIKMDTCSVDNGTKVFVTKRLNGDTLGDCFVKWPGIRLNFLEDKKTNNYRVQAKVSNGTIVSEIFVPRKSVTVSDMNNNIGLLGNFAPKDGTSNVGVFYNKGIGPFTIGGSVATQIKQYDNIQLGIQAGVRF